jgi:hypothetical protein
MRNATLSQPPTLLGGVAVVARASDFRACLERPVWYTHELTLTGHGEVIA